MSPEKTFIVLATVAGLCMAFVMPAFMVPDEGAHFDRAYQVGSGSFLSQNQNGATGGVVPVIPDKTSPPLPRDEYFKTVRDSDRKFVAFPSSALYSPVGYIPQAVGIDVGRIIHPSLGVMVIAGRIFNLIAYVMLVWVAIRIARYGKWVYAAAGLFPVAIQEAASLSADVMTIGLSFIAVAFIYNLFYQKVAVSSKQYIIISVLALGLGLTKQTNLLFLLPILFLPSRLVPSFKKRTAILVCSLVLCLVASLAWWAIVKYHHYDYNYAMNIQSIGSVNQSAQLSGVLHHPLSFAKVVFKTYIYEGFKGVPLADFYWTSMYGFFSVFVYKLPIPFIALGYTTLLLAFMYREDKEKDEVSGRAVAAQTGTLILSVLAIAAGLYLAWTPVGGAQVSGIQGRYFIPLLPLLIPLFALLRRWVKVTLDKPYRIGMFISSIAMVNLAAMIVLTYMYF